MPRYALGLDFGTNSCRSLIVDLADGREVAEAVSEYPSGEAGILLDPRDPNVARQNPQDYLDALAVVPTAIEQARAADPSFDPAQVVGLGMDTTGSTPMPVDADGTPLAFHEEFAGDLNAMAWLWKDHTSHAEAARITEVARDLRPAYLARCGGTYSSEWLWSKALHCRHVAPDVFEATHSFVEYCDWLPAVLAGETKPATIVRSVCAAGHKAMYCEDWGGLPDAEFLASVDRALAELRGRMYEKAVPSDHVAGRLCNEWAARLGLPPGIPIAVGALDAHMGAVGSGVREGTLVKILGTSTCDMMVRSHDADLADIPGVCGIVDGSILPGCYGIEAGQSAVGDILLWFVNHLVPGEYGASPDEKFGALAEAAGEQAPGEPGLLALDWNNGNRSILVDAGLTGLLVGQTLHTSAHEVYRALIEGTAFGALTIIGRLEAYGVSVSEIVACGGLAVRNPLLMQVYADVTGRPMKVARSDQACALGAGIFGAVAAGAFPDVPAAQDAMCGVRDTVYTPDAAAQPVYAALYALYRQLHDAFGTEAWSGALYNVMKDLIAIRDRQRA
ncbi:MAG: ribulokinase [bacterium]